MATKAATKTQKESEKPEAGQAAEAPDSPLLDLSDAAVKKLIKTAKKRGYVTYEELNSVMPSEEVSTDQIEDIMAMFSDMGINVVDEDEVEEAEPDTAEEESTEVAERTGTAVTSKSNTREGSDRTDDPVRMYLREMGSVELLSREGEIAIAKRIEAGRDTMILGLCESPLTFNAIIDWSTALNNGDMQLREIVDLEAMLSKDPAPENLEEEGAEDNGEISEKTAGVSFKDEDEVEEEPAAESDDEDGESSSGKRETFE